MQKKGKWADQKQLTGMRVLQFWTYFVWWLEVGAAIYPAYFPRGGRRCMQLAADYCNYGTFEM